MSKSKKTLSRLKKDLDKVFNAFIRKRDTVYGRDWEGFKCISCQQVKPLNQMHAGHFYAGTFTATRWDERNVNGQCAGCNTFKHGNLLEYRKGILSKYGQETLDELEALHNQPFKLERLWLIEQIEKYKALTHTI